MTATTFTAWVVLEQHPDGGFVFESVVRDRGVPVLYVKEDGAIDAAAIYERVGKINMRPVRVTARLAVDEVTK